MKNENAISEAKKKEEQKIGSKSEHLNREEWNKFEDVQFKEVVESDSTDKSIDQQTDFKDKPKDHQLSVQSKQISLIGFDDVPFQDVTPSKKTSSTKKNKASSKNSEKKNTKKPWSTKPDTMINIPVEVIIDTGTSIQIDMHDMNGSSSASASEIREFLRTVGKPYRFRLLQEGNTLFNYNESDHYLQITVKNAPKGGVELSTYLSNHKVIEAPMDNYLLRETCFSSIVTRKDISIDNHVHYGIPTIMEGIFLNKKIPYHLFRSIVSFLKYFANHRLEAGATILFNKESSKYEIYIPQQTAEELDLNLIYSDLPSHCYKVMEIHSHHHHSGQFSMKDDINEVHEMYYLVLGRYGNGHFKEMSIRQFVGDKHLPANFYNIFEFPSKNVEPALNNEWLRRVKIGG